MKANNFTTRIYPQDGSGQQSYPTIPKSFEIVAITFLGGPGGSVSGQFKVKPAFFRWEKLKIGVFL